MDILWLSKHQATQANVIPYITERTPYGQSTMDPFSRLLKERIVYLGTQVDDLVANSISAQMLYLASEDAEKPISLYINSPGGSVSAGMAIFDTMMQISCPVHTYANGMAASMGAFLLAAGAPGKRYAMKNSTVMIHQPLGGAQGQATDIEIQAREIIRIKTFLTGYLAQRCNKEYRFMADACERDNFLTADKAKEMGLVDQVVSASKAKVSYAPNYSWLETQPLPQF
jgi:ATP-dependent Clp protease, protease subunit